MWRFAMLYQAGAVDSLYVAVPTRAAARQWQGRANQALKRMFAEPTPEAVLAIPGQMLAGEARDIRLPDFRTRWDDGENRRGGRRNMQRASLRPRSPSAPWTRR